MSDSAEYASVRVVRAGNDSGIFLDAYVTAVNTAGNKPFEGKVKGVGPSITLGSNFEADGFEIYTDGSGTSYFIKPEKREIIRLRERYRSANMNGPSRYGTGTKTSQKPR